MSKHSSHNDCRVLNPHSALRTPQWIGLCLLAMALAAPVLAQLPTPILDIGLNEASGNVATNSGSAGGILTNSSPVPYWTNNVPAGVGGLGSVDFQTNTGNYSVESPTNYPQLGGLAKFTIAAWVNCRSTNIGPGGNRIITWIKGGGNGVDLVCLANGSVRIGINQWPDATGGTTNLSSAARITADATASATNWCFVAVSYDSTLASNHLKFYFGSNSGDATLDVARNYYRGTVGTTISNLCIGHFNRATRSAALDRMFRGLIDEVKVFGDALTIEQILVVQRGSVTTTAPGFVLQPVSQTVLENQPVTFSVTVTGVPLPSVQWQRNSNDIAGASGLAYSISPSMVDDGAAFRAVVSNSVGQAASSNAILTVTRDVTPPTVLSVTTSRTARNLTNVFVKFSEPVDIGSAQEPGNYSISGGSLTTYSAVVQPDLVSVLLTLDALTPDTSYAVTISGVNDRANLGNVMSETNFTIIGPPVRLPPIVAVHLEEGAGTVVTNSGLAGGTLNVTVPLPYWTNNVPSGLGSAWSADFGTNAGYYYIESPTNYPQLAGLAKFTISGWVNCRQTNEGGGGNRIVAWNSPGGEGVDLVYHYDGSLQMGINQWPDGVPAQSSASKITSDADAAMDNWRFFAVTYDSTLPGGQVKFYFGSSASAATLDAARDYARGAVGSAIRPFVIGHFNDLSRTNSGLQNRMFRGLIDDVQVFDDALSPEEIVVVQRPGGNESPVGFVLEPVSQAVLEHQPVTFSVMATGAPPISVQWQRNSNDIAGATSLSYWINSASITDDGAAFRVVVSNALGMVASSNAILTVMRETTPPAVVAVNAAHSPHNLTNVTVRFSERVEQGTAEEPGNYALSGGLTTYSAALQPDGVTVLLTLDALTPDASYILAISGVTDWADQPNMIVATNCTFLAPPSRLPPLVSMRFAEASGTLTTNAGTLGGSAALLQQNAYPVFSANVPTGTYVPAENVSAVDFGDIAAGQGARAVDLTTISGTNGTVGGFSAFTVCGWVNARSLVVGSGGNRMVYAAAALNGPGFDLVQLSDGALRLGVNEWPDNPATGGGPLSSVGKITSDALASATNWVFFAVTYDSSASGGQVKYYFGNPDRPAQLDVTGAYARGPVLTSGKLTVGNFSVVDMVARTNLSNSRVFRGLVDDVRVFDDALTLQEILAVQCPNIPPTVSNCTLGAIINQPTNISWLKLLEGCSDLNQDPLVISSVSPTSTNGGTVLLTSTNVIYTPPADYAGADAFAFTVSDGQGGIVVGVVFVTIEDSRAHHIVSYRYDAGSGNMTLNFAGIPGYTYRIQYTESLTPPVLWSDVATNTAPENGLFQLVAPVDGATNGFYRTVGQGLAQP